MRSRTTALAFLLVLTAAACNAPESSSPDGGSAPSASGWDQFGASATRDRNVGDSGPASEPGILWSALIDQGMATEPIVATVADRRLVLVSGVTHLHAIDMATGHEAWSADIKGALSSPPTVLGDRIWVGTLDGFAVVLDAATGQELAEHEVDFPLDAPAFRIGGLVGFEETSMKGRHGESRFHLLDLGSAETRWYHDYVAAGAAAPASDGERAYVHHATGVIALSVADGAVAWTHEREPRSTLLGPVLAGGRLFVQSVRRPPTGFLTCLDLATGEQVWEQAMTRRALAQPAATEDALLLVTSAVQLERRATATGELVWASPLPDRAQGSPVIAGERVFVGGPGFVAGYRLSDGVQLWSLEIDGEAAYVSVDGDSLLVATAEGFVHRLAAAS